ncbi:hypothetical protein BH11MYX3_BH11MYX3_03260 [soil metagenome]
MSDAHAIGAPPRELTASMRRYIDIASATMVGFWIAASVMFTLTHVLIVAVSGKLYFPPVLPVVFIGLAVLHGRKAADQRLRITRVLTEGAVTIAEVRKVEELATRRMLTIAVLYRVEGTERDIEIAGTEQALASLQVGMREQVIYLPSEPSLLVPTFLIA